MVTFAGVNNYKILNSIIMRTITLTLISFAFVINFTNAQTITPQVVATSGGYMLNGGYSVSWTLGEPVIATAQNGSTTLTQGFQQPSYNVLSITTQTIEGFEVNVYPNPSSDFVVIDWTTDLQNMIYITLFDMAGKMISEQSFAATQDKVSLNMSKLASAQYLLEVKTQNNSVTKIFRITKK